MAECRNRVTLRGIARIHGDVDGALPAAGAPMDTGLIGSGLLTITIRPDGGEPYQGIVPLSGTTVAEAVEGYFEQSEQIPTKLLLSADDHRAAGLLLQSMPPEFREAERAPGERREDFRRVCILADTVDGEELRGTANETLLTRLFHEERVLVEPPSPLAFRCTCNRDRTREALRAMSRAELEQIVEEEGEIEMDCQFCHAVYRFDGIDLEILFRDDPVDPDATPTGPAH
jgi:molecular chaperone Hsp33